MPPGGDALEAAVTTASMFWPELLAPQKLAADAIHKFAEVRPVGPVTHIRLNIFPDGGVSRIRIFGRLAE
jgi:allantoicase